MNNTNTPNGSGRKALLLAGSPKGLKGTSHELGRSLVGKLAALRAHPAGKM